MWNDKILVFDFILKRLLIFKLKFNLDYKIVCIVLCILYLVIKYVNVLKKNYMQLYRMSSYIKVKSCGGAKTS